MIENLRLKIARKRAELDAARAESASLSAKLQDARKTLEQWTEVQGIIQNAAQAVQNVIHTQIADVVTRCLQTVYDDSISFKIEFDRKRGKTEARLYFLKDGNEVDPIEASGLGWCEVAAFALRMAVLKLHTPAVAQVLVLDESFKFLDREAKPRMAQLLMALSKEMSIQIVLVTHDDEFRIGEVINLGGK